MHSPAPWTIIQSSGQLAIWDATQDRVCYAEGAEDAKLMAAAPDMLTALEEIVAEWDTIHAEEDHRTGYTLDTAGIAMARAAISKATKT